VGDDESGSLLIKLGAIAPTGVASATIRYDDVAFGSCGNCIVEQDSGEVCDDGNNVSGDGCSATCQFECGNARVESPEQCDDGNTTFGDSCTATCRNLTSCDTCAQTSCAPTIDACLALTGVAEAGPRTGTARSTLCASLRDCIHDSGCNENTAIANRPTIAGAPSDSTNPGVPENCYCGSSGVDCLDDGAANGSCKAEVEAALETVDPYRILQRVSGAEPEFPVFDAAAELLDCEQTSCTDQCAKIISCGNGLLEDRTQEFALGFMFMIDRLPQPCSDSYTHTGAGCSFEECDDGNNVDGDGCDSNCFLEACGNYLKQGSEECDDGNREDGDGCDSNCVAEYECGDGDVSAPFEDCEPPGTGDVCSLDQYTTDPTSCGCDSACVYKVCGNNVVQDGEECDPPNGASCDDTCHRNVDDCTACILRLDANQYCPADMLLNGNGIPGDPFGPGCLQDPVCMALWDCERESKCGTYPKAFGTCYCGPDQADLDACESNDFVPKGVCKNELLTAFEEQWGRPPTNNSEIVDSFFSVPPTPSKGPLITTTLLIDSCLGPEGGFVPPLREQLTNSGLTPDEVTACMAACFP
jgi:cysteine-rich repeat protein